ncbi:unnamed protein product [Triticum turgidum subsp. durum]|uniref:Uncharacterized protein n=1 Tax=Triticum turgidum subsp. durum TaxID=4567 RepID=A0A9R0RT46_TRITD|nr:unnamed protein product [Triticum turgidum subsp. durum]
MSSQEKFFDDQIENLYKAMEEKESEYEKGLQEERAKSKRDELIKAHEKKKVQLKREYMEKEVELEKELDAALTFLMEKHEPDTFKASSSSS